jgi:hypothetical protein
MGLKILSFLLAIILQINNNQLVVSINLSSNSNLHHRLDLATEGESCAVLSPALNDSSKWKPECYHLNFTIANNFVENNENIFQVFRTCFKNSDNSIHIDINVKDNCVLKISRLGSNETVVYNGGNSELFVSVTKN